MVKNTLSDDETLLKTVFENESEISVELESKNEVQINENIVPVSNRVYFQNEPLEKSFQNVREQGLNDVLQSYFELRDRHEVRNFTNESNDVDNVAIESARVNINSEDVSAGTDEAYEDNIVQCLMKNESVFENQSDVHCPLSSFASMNNDETERSTQMLICDVERRESSNYESNVPSNDDKAVQREILNVEKNVSRVGNIVKPPMFMSEDDLVESEDEDFKETELDCVPIIVDHQFTPYVVCRSGEISVNCLLDAGSDVSILSEQTWRLINSNVSSPKLRNGDTIILQDYVGFRRRNLKGLALIPLQLGEFEFVVEAAVLPRLAEDFILGNNFLNFYSASIDYEHAELQLKVRNEVMKFPMLKKCLKRDVNTMQSENVDDATGSIKETGNNVKVANHSICVNPEKHVSVEFSGSKDEFHDSEANVAENSGSNELLRVLGQCCHISLNNHENETSVQKQI